MHISFAPFSLSLKHPFAIAGNTRRATPVVFTKIEQDGLVGEGEASLPPYLPESQESVQAFLSSLDLAAFNASHSPVEVMEYVNSKALGNYAAKASVDIALHDLWGKISAGPLWKMLGSDSGRMPDTSCTLGMDSPGMIREKLKETQPYKIIKLKMGGDNDRAIVETVRSHTFKALCADANQGWTDRQQALEMIWFLKDQGCKFVEQPLPKDRIRDMVWLSENSPLPLVADESCQGPQDILALHGVFRGINIKLMKCGGILKAQEMIALARKLDMKILMGCMNESSCAILAGAALAPQCNWADLDGPFLITNNPYRDPSMQNGKIVLSDAPGLGLVSL